MTVILADRCGIFAMKNDTKDRLGECLCSISEFDQGKITESSKSTKHVEC